MKISATTLHKFLSDRGWDWAAEYGEPGYQTHGDDSTPAVVFGDYWIYEHDPRYRGTRSTGMSSWFERYPRFMGQLEQQGVVFEWHDEWCEIDGKAYRTQPDSYSWQPSFVEVDGDRFVVDSEDPDSVDQLVELFVNEPTRAIALPDFDTGLLEARRFRQYNGEFASGWYEGQIDDPNEITRRIRTTPGMNASEIVFVLSGVGQFDIHWTTWVRQPMLSKTSSSYRTWMQRFESGVVTHAQASQFAKAVYTKSLGLMQRGKRTNITTSEANLLVTSLQCAPVKVADDYRHEKGMTTYAVARKWLAREAKRAGITGYDFTMVDEFFFVGCYDHGGRYGNVYPIYECRWADGRRFRYSPSPWQAGTPADRAAFHYWEVAMQDSVL